MVGMSTDTFTFLSSCHYRKGYKKSIVAYMCACWVLLLLPEMNTSSHLLIFLELANT